MINYQTKNQQNAKLMALLNKAKSDTIQNVGISIYPKLSDAAINNIIKEFKKQKVSTTEKN